MKLPDVNVLIYAHRRDSTDDHEAYAKWLIELAEGNEWFGLSEAVLSGFIRIVTNPRIFPEPTPLEQAFDFCRALRERPQANILRPGVRNWAIFQALCGPIPARGKWVADAWHAALAIEYGCIWVSTDSDFSRFPNLKWCHPLQSGKL